MYQKYKIWNILEGFDKQTDVVNLFNDGGHSPSCFWVGGYEVGRAESYELFML